MSSMSSLSKGKYTPNLNIFSMNKSQQTNVKKAANEPRRPADSSHSHKVSDLQAKHNLQLPREPKESNKDEIRDLKEAQSNSFRQAVNMQKFKTTKCSRNIFINTSGEEHISREEGKFH